VFKVRTVTHDAPDKKYDQEVHKDYPIHCYDERYKIIATLINSNTFADLNLKK